MKNLTKHLLLLLISLEATLLFAFFVEKVVAQTKQEISNSLAIITQPTPISTPTPTPACPSYTNCEDCLAVLACAWGKAGVASCRLGGAICPAGYTEWYWSDCTVNVCTAPTLTPVYTCVTSGGQCTGTNVACKSLGSYVWGGYGSPYCSSAAPQCCVPAATPTPTSVPVNAGQYCNDSNERCPRLE